MFLALGVAASAKDVKVSSPDGSLTVTVGVDGGKAWYSVTRGQQAVINRSELGFVLKDGDFKDGFKMGKVTRSSLDETWSQPWGEDAQVRNHYNEMRVRLQEPLQRDARAPAGEKNEKTEFGRGLPRL